MNTLQKIVITFIVIVITTLSYFLGKCHNTNSVLNDYVVYTIKCETLLDSISIWDNTFEDTVVETDVYQDYLEARGKLYNSLK